MLTQRPVHDGNDADAEEAVLEDKWKEVWGQCLQDGTITGAICIIGFFYYSF